MSQSPSVHCTCSCVESIWTRSQPVRMTGGLVQSAHVGANDMPPTVQQQRDNLTIGLYLAYTGGATLDYIFQAALGYIPNGPIQREYYDRRFREAQRVGRDAFKNRTPGYFTFNAMPFGNTYIYKVTWYVWINPDSRSAQTVPLPVADLASMRDLRDTDLDTRQSTTRSVRAAHDIEEQMRAIARRDWPALQVILARMAEDESLGEILSGWYGLPYADIQDIIPKLANERGMFSFQRDAARIKQHERRLRQAQAQLSSQLNSWVMLQTGVPSNAPQLALDQAQQRLLALPNP